MLRLHNWCKRMVPCTHRKFEKLIKNLSRLDGVRKMCLSPLFSTWLALWMVFSFHCLWECRLFYEFDVNSLTSFVSITLSSLNWRQYSVQSSSNYAVVNTLSKYCAISRLFVAYATPNFTLFLYTCCKRAFGGFWRILFFPGHFEKIERLQ